MLGKPFEITNGTFTIVGVAPGDFDLPQGSDAWVTFAAINPDLLEEDAYGTLDLVGRLRPGRTAEEGRRELDRLVAEVDGNQWSADARLAMTVRPLDEVVVGQVRPALQVLGAAALLVFLVAVLNLGNLLVVRGLERQREFAIRRAIGASRASLVRQVVVETVLMVALGGAVGLGLALVAWRILPRSRRPTCRASRGSPPTSPSCWWRSSSGFLAVVNGERAAGALAPRGRPASAPRGRWAASATRSRPFAWTGAIAMQVTLAVVTLVASLLLVRTLYHLERLEPGFELDDLGLAQIALLSSDSATVARGHQLVEQLVERVSALPGVPSVTTAITRPLSGTAGWDFGFIGEGQTDAQAAANPYLNYEAIRAELLRDPAPADPSRARLRGGGSGGLAAGRDRQPVAGETGMAGPGSDRQAPPLGR